MIDSSKLRISLRPRTLLLGAALLCSILIALVINSTQDAAPTRSAPQRISSGQEEGLGGSRHRADIARSFSQNHSIKSQLRFLLEASKENDAYAACALARALDICRKRDADNEADVSLDAYASAHTASLSEQEVDSLANAIAIREKTASAMCDLLTDDEQKVFDEIVYKSAQLGDPTSMRIFALQDDKRTIFGEPVPVSKAHIDRHGMYAEKMLNLAAEAGDPVAIKAIYSIYATGAISTSFDRVKVRRDDVKSVAAYKALEAVGDFRLKARSSAGEIEQARKDIDETVSGFGQAEQIRLAKLKEKYVRAYRSKKRPDSIREELFDTLPEQACADSGR